MNFILEYAMSTCGAVYENGLENAEKCSKDYEIIYVVFSWNVLCLQNACLTGLYVSISCISMLKQY